MLITDIYEVQEYASVSSDLDIRALTPHLRRATKRFLTTYLGDEFMEELEAGYKTRSWSDELEKAHGLACAVLVPASLYYYINVGGASIDNSGIYYAKNGQRWNLGEGEREKLACTYLDESLDNLDELLSYVDRQGFASYTSSAARKKERNSLVRSAETVRNIFEVTHPRVTFRALREAITYEEEARVKHIMQGYYNTLLNIENPTGTDAELLAIAQRAIVYLAVSRALLTRTVKLTSEGLQVLIGNKNQISASENARIEASAREYKKSGEERLEALIEKLETILPTGYIPKPKVKSKLHCKPNRHGKIAFF